METDNGSSPPGSFPVAHELIPLERMLSRPRQDLAEITFMGRREQARR
jgi:hypothetical protein